MLLTVYTELQPFNPFKCCATFPENISYPSARTITFIFCACFSVCRDQQDFITSSEVQWACNPAIQNPKLVPLQPSLLPRLLNGVQIIPGDDTSRLSFQIYYNGFDFLGEGGGLSTNFASNPNS